MSWTQVFPQYNSLSQLLSWDGLSSGQQVYRLASVLCGWLIQWPQATQLSDWVFPLFLQLTRSGRSCLVADAIAIYGTKVMFYLFELDSCLQYVFHLFQILDVSLVPVYLTTNCPIIIYMLLAYCSSWRDFATFCRTGQDAWNSNPMIWASAWGWSKHGFSII